MFDVVPDVNCAFTLIDETGVPGDVTDPETDQ